MQLVIHQNSNGYYLALILSYPKRAIYRATLNDGAISNYLNIDRRDYINILLRHGARNIDFLYVFANKIDVERALTELEPYMIMRNLE